MKLLSQKHALAELLIAREKVPTRKVVLICWGLRLNLALSWELRTGYGRVTSRSTIIRLNAWTRTNAIAMKVSTDAVRGRRSQRVQSGEHYELH